MGDLHSTLHDIFLVADPKRHPGPLYDYVTPSLNEFGEEIIDLLQRRVRFRLADQKVGAPPACSRLLADISELWTTNKREQPAFKKWVDEMQPTLREIIRETRGLLIGSSAQFKAKLLDHGRIEALAKKGKAAYFATEISLMAGKPPPVKSS